MKLYNKQIINILKIYTQPSYSKLIHEAFLLPTIIIHLPVRKI